MSDEDKLIAEAFVQVRNGITSGNWQLVCDAYFLISGEKLDPPVEPTSRLDRIRDQMKQASGETEQKSNDKDDDTDKDDDEEDPPKSEEDSTGELKISPDEIKVSIQERSIEDDKEPRFGKPKVKVISTGVDKSEVSLNKKRKQKTVKEDRPRGKDLDMSQPTKMGGITYYPKPERPEK